MWHPFQNWKLATFYNSALIQASKSSTSAKLKMQSSDGLIELLKRNNITPTNDSGKDLKLAAEFMPPKYQPKTKKGNNYVK